jgi:hypothetical protein
MSKYKSLSKNKIAETKSISQSPQCINCKREAFKDAAAMALEAVISRELERVEESIDSIPDNVIENSSKIELNCNIITSFKLSD